ncbi:MAG: FAD-dependent oxidoreductase [Cellulomonas sp.]|nr:FAD-dependent oxidoreductase [Cellulomonas sp.]
MSSPDPAPSSDVLVVGAGLAATATVAELRRAGFGGTVRVLGDERIAPYDRPPLSKHLLDRDSPRWLADEIGADLLALADDVRLGEPATGLDLSGARPEVRTADGRFTAGTLVLATGSRPRLPAAWGAARTLRTFADATDLRAALGAPSRLVVIGAGWVGSEVAGVAAAAGHEVVVVEAGAAPLGLGAVRDQLSPWFAAAGVRLLLSSPVRTVHPGLVELDDGRTLEADVVLAAVGARPATGWLSGALPLTTTWHLQVDERMRVLTDPQSPGHGSVRAVGDLVVRRSARRGWVTGGHWDNALRGPRALAADLTAGPDTIHDPAPYVFSHQLGHDVALFGTPSAQADVILRRHDGAWTALWVRDDRLQAALVVDNPREVAAVRRLLSGPDLPRVDPRRAGDAAQPLATR